MLLMVQSLRSYPLELVQKAFDHLREYPINGFTGMPSEADIAATVRKLADEQRQAEIAEAQRQQSAAEQAELRELQRRKDAGEEMFGWEDLVKHASEHLGVDLGEAKKMPESPQVDFAERAKFLDEQKEFLLRRNSQ